MTGHVTSPAGEGEGEEGRSDDAPPPGSRYWPTSRSGGSRQGVWSCY